MRWSAILFVVICCSCAWLLSGCVESSFQLSDGSRLPVWIKLPPGVRRQDVSLSLNYYATFSGSHLKFILRNKRGEILEEVIGSGRVIGDISKRPTYTVATVGGVPEVIEHRIFGPVFWVSDDPELKNKLLYARE